MKDSVKRIGSTQSYIGVKQAPKIVEAPKSPKTPPSTGKFYNGKFNMP